MSRVGILRLQFPVNRIGSICCYYGLFIFLLLIQLNSHNLITAGLLNIQCHYCEINLNETIENL